MGIKAGASDLLEKGKAALDANGDGKIEAKEVLDALGERAKETADAAVEAAEEVRKGFDANGDGEITVDEVKAVAEGAVEKAKGAMKDLLGTD